MADAREREARETYERFVAVRDEIDAGKKPWSVLADFFTEDAAYIDPAWGRVEGRENIREFFVKSMAGLTGHGWYTPENWISVEGPRVLSQWDQVLGKDADGNPLFVAGLSILYYAGNGLFCYSHDMLNMAHVFEVMKKSGWKPNAEMNMPPREPVRDVSLPKAWRHLEARRP
ncbi:MAG: nuclear transport factor 2 family protein [Candidatus Binatia bacterium]